MITKLDIFKTHLATWLSAKGDRKKRGELAREISRIAQIHPKSVNRSFRRVQMRDRGKPEGRGRRAVYTKDVDAALWEVWEAASCPCGENLFPLISEYIRGFRLANRWKHSSEATDKLLAMSLGTVKTRVKALRLKYGINRGKSTTKPSALKRIIPIFKGPWDKLDPGNGQLDTVAHCGDSLGGDFVYTVNYTDAALYWGKRRAQWNKGQTATKNNMAAIKKKLPFRWIMGHPDSGSEFINWIAKDWCDENGIALTRSEPGRKNDNMYVEERNGHIVRKYLGWTRLDADPEIVDLINDYYDVLDLYLNHFQAVRRTLSKERIGAKYHRTFEPRAMTPYERLMNHPQVPDEVKQAVRLEHESLNPLLLKEKLDKLGKRIFDFQRTHTKN
jgi:hypothetical protein